MRKICAQWRSTTTLIEDSMRTVLHQVQAERTIEEMSELLADNIQNSSS